ncbi:MAG: hypothetical protein ACREIR_09915 [Geminicoccaceae bacterium]
MRAEKYVLLPDEDAVEFKSLEAALTDELAPEGVMQSLLVGRIVRAAWRLERAERLEVELFEERRYLDGGPGLALIRDGNATRSFETLSRYRGAALAELWRALRTLKALQGQARATPRRAGEVEPAAVLMFKPRRGHGAAIAPEQGAPAVAPCGKPIEPEVRGKPGESEPAPSAAEQPRRDRHAPERTTPRAAEILANRRRRSDRTSPSRPPRGGD